MYCMTDWKPTVQCIASFMVSLWSACVRTFNNFTMGLIVVPCMWGEGRKGKEEDSLKRCTHFHNQTCIVCAVFAPHDLWTPHSYLQVQRSYKTCSQLGMRLYPSLKHMQSYIVTPLLSGYAWTYVVTTMWVQIPPKASFKKSDYYIHVYKWWAVFCWFVCCVVWTKHPWVLEVIHTYTITCTNTVKSTSVVTAVSILRLSCSSLVSSSVAGLFSDGSSEIRTRARENATAPRRPL